MRRFAMGLAVSLLATVTMAQETPSPHVMTKADGSLDMQKCPICHTANMGLNMPRRQTCTLCHLETTHGGSLAHLAAPPARVQAAMANAPDDAPALPLREDGGLFCGTCHIYHDPMVLKEHWLEEAWVPPDRGLAAAVRTEVTDRATRLAEGTDPSEPVVRFSPRGTQRLRLPFEDGSLCRVCHGELR